MRRASHPNAITLAFLLVGALWACRPAVAASARHVAHPTAPGRTVEYFVEEPAGPAPWPTVVLLHGHQEGVRRGGGDFVAWGVLRALAARGYLAVAVSQPGYGGSSGPADFSGPVTQDAVLGVLADLRARRLVAPGRLLLEGISRGALTAALVAARDSTVTGLVLISGVYDLPAYAQAPDTTAARAAVLEALRAETGGGEAALRARSVLPVAGRIRAATLILNGAQDDRTVPAQARALADAIGRAGGEAQAVIYAEHGHRIPVAVRERDAAPFIDRVLGAGEPPAGRAR